MQKPLLLAFLAALAACQTQAPSVPGTLPSTGEVLVTVNGHSVHQSMLDATMENLPPELRAQIETMSPPEALIEQLVAQELLYQEAITRGLHNDQKLATRLALAERMVLTQAVLEAVTAERTTDDSVKAWFDEHLVQFSRPQVKLASIVVTDQALAEKTAAEAQAGGDFSALAAERSLDPKGKATGGEMGWFGVDRVLPQLQGALERATPGTVIGPEAIQGAFHVFKVLDTRATVPFEEVKDEVVERLKAELTEKYLQEIIDGATVVTADKPSAAPAAGGVTPPELPSADAPAPESSEG
jgi:peptidyl-prolyl cis-trans isomerase C